MDESCSIQAPSSSCIKKNETTEVVSQKSNFEGSPHLSKSNGGIICKEILLEDAVRDEKGKIKVYEYGMGEKG